MKAETQGMTALTMMSFILFTLASCSSTPKSPPRVGSAVETYKKGEPGGEIVQTVKVTAIVTAIDHAERTATLLVPDGKKFSVKAGRQAVNFDQVSVGDRITAVVTQRFVFSLEKGGAASADGTAAVAAQAMKGDQPGGLAAETTQVTGKIVAVNLEKNAATVEFDDGVIQTFSRNDVDLSQHMVGEKVVLRVTEMVAVSVEKEH